MPGSAQDRRGGLRRRGQRRLDPLERRVVVLGHVDAVAAGHLREAVVALARVEKIRGEERVDALGGRRVILR